jgi:HNH endonuclease
VNVHREVGRGSKTTRYVHSLVLEAFVGPKPAGHTAHHWNRDQTDNRLVNLRWATEDQNQRNKFQRKLTDEQVREIRRRHSTGEMGCKRLATLFGVNRTTVRELVKGRTYRELLPA